jgi:hypothetical protein
MIKVIAEYFHISHAEGWSDCDSKLTSVRLRSETQARPFVLIGRNFITILEFSMTTKDPQGQKCEDVGIYLKESYVLTGKYILPFYVPETVKTPAY